MRGDGNGWVQCAAGHRHWGRHGAAGLLLRTLDDQGQVRVLMQHRAAWSHDGDTWGVPGGARDSHETVVAAALREAAEETGLPVDVVRVRGTSVDDHGAWSYTTTIADCAGVLPVTACAESVQLRWLREDDVDALPLHPGFARTWASLRAARAHVVIDAANVVGARPDGWWRDRLGAARRLCDDLVTLRGRVIRLTGMASWAVIERTVLVVEGQASGLATEPAQQVSVVAAPGSGDDEVVRQVLQVRAADAVAVVVTSDRELRTRVDGAVLLGPRALRELLAS